MTIDSSSRRSSDQRIARVLSDIARRRAAGQPLSDSEILAEHAELGSRLVRELYKLQQISEAIEQADERQHLRALSRLQADWHRDNSRGLLSTKVRHLQAGDCTPRRDVDPARPSGREHGDSLPDGGNSDTDHEMIGRYQVVGLLGAGGFGRVYQARDAHLDRDVAIKVPHQQPETEEEFHAFLNEARVAASIDHPAIVPVFDAGKTDDGECYVVSKLIRGANLADRISAARLEHQEAIFIVITVAGALHDAHARGLVHRDIKPANILLDEESNPYLADFGLALRGRVDDKQRSYAGTPAYMSPEQARGESHRVDRRSDLFSLGIVLFELLTGRKPFDAVDHDELLEQIIWSEPPRPRDLDDAIPYELQRVCLKTLAKRATDRYPTALALVEDLRCLLESQAGEGSGVPGTSAGGAAAADIHKGLRAFESADADAFLELVPGLRDRDRLPEPIRVWKRRIESSKPEDSFSVGVIYGPSGSGKSSLIRAGILPRLADHVRSIYLPATRDETEQNLVQRIQKLSGLNETKLVDALAALRCGRGVRQGDKVLIVLDQFEQWLHGRGESERRLLVQALRQCDGEHLQCLLLVRDDFWLAVSRFMAELEVDLVQGQNAALVDLFDTLHARKVLTSFGRALGHSPRTEPDGGSQLATFVDKAVDALAEHDRVVPIRLALFAEMVKSRPWIPSTLRSSGGAAGIGVAFLEATFSSRLSNPQSRFHERAARAVLAALLPEPHSTIKGHVKSYPELLEISGYGNDPVSFKALMRLLDGETRLITPADSGEDEANVGQRYYQLTHDYLVPALREWLTKREKLTWRGRVEKTLVDRSIMWSAKREKRQLPSLWESLSICLFTERGAWNAAQRTMMRAAFRHHLLIAMLLGLAALSFFTARTEFGASFQQLVLRARAHAAGVWLAFGKHERVWPLLEHSANPTQRTNVIHRLSFVVTDPEQVVAEMEGQTDPSIRRAMLLIAGELVLNARKRPNSPAATRYAEPPPQFLAHLRGLYRGDPDPGVHSAAEWTLRAFGDERELAREDGRLAAQQPSHHTWRLADNQHTLVEIQPIPFLGGAAASIQHSFCLATKETTREQFQRFRRDRGLSTTGTGDDGWLPETRVSWHEAAAYCNWLSQLAGIPADQWCYSIGSRGEVLRPILGDVQLMARRGYRLPTEAEWEFACRSLAATDYSCGSSLTHLDRYAVFQPAREPRRVGELKPNDFGLFDMHGNAAEWCHNATYFLDTSGPAGNRAAGQSAYHAVRGGSCWDSPPQLTCASRRQYVADTRRADLGFRVAISAMP